MGGLFLQLTCHWCGSHHCPQSVTPQECSKAVTADNGKPRSIILCEGRMNESKAILLQKFLFNRLKNPLVVWVWPMQGHWSSDRTRKAVKELRAMATFKKQKKLFSNNTCFCLAAMLSSKNITKMKNILNFLGARIAAINLFQVDLDKLWNYL